MVTDCRNKYDGTRRSPWNEIECGDHYARAMAAFLYFEIAAGMVSLSSIYYEHYKYNTTQRNTMQFNSIQYYNTVMQCNTVVT